MQRRDPYTGQAGVAAAQRAEGHFEVRQRIARRVGEPAAFRRQRDPARLALEQHDAEP